VTIDIADELRRRYVEWMLNQVAARLRQFFGKARESHGLHAPFHVTTHHGHIVQSFNPSNRRSKPSNSWAQIIM
jgi:hypothetical protein